MHCRHALTIQTAAPCTHCTARSDSLALCRHALQPLAPVAMAYNPSTSGHGPSTQHFTDSLYTYLQVSAHACMAGGEAV